MIAALLCAALALGARAADADLILRGGKIFLGPGKYAAALAVTGNRISGIGTNAEVLTLKGKATRVIDLKGRAVTPGFHDAHVHLIKGALFVTQADLTGAATIDEIQARVREFSDAHPNEAWVLGRGWDETLLPDVAVATRPVALTDADGHKMWLNSEALRLTGVRPSRDKPLKPDVVRDADGQPTGVFLEDGMKLVTRVIPAPGRAAKLAALRQALARMRESGVTAVDSMPGLVDTPAEEQLALWRELAEKGEATARLLLYGRLEDPAGYAKLKLKARDLPRTRVLLPGVKGFVDGVIGDRTAALLAPYFDAPETRGEPRQWTSTLYGAVRAAHKEGLQVALHAVGDRAVRLALDACERSAAATKAEGVVLPAYPCRIEHAELLDAEDAPRFAKWRTGASMQPSHMTFNTQADNYYPNRLGERVQRAFAWRSLEEAGALLAFGTDWPVAPLHPRNGLYAAVTRLTLDGKPVRGWVPDQRISLESAVSHYTADPWTLAGHGDEIGDLRLGRIADLVVFDRDLFKMPVKDLLKAEVDVTIFDGRVVFERQQ